MRRPVTRSAVFAALLLALVACLIVLSHLFVPLGDGPTATVTGAPASGSPVNPDDRPAAESQDRKVRDVTPQGVARVFMPPPVAGSKRMPAVTSIRITEAG